jgi:hypothetical protein
MNALEVAPGPSAATPMLKGPLIPVAAVFAFENPVVLFRPNNQPAGNAQALQRASVFQNLIERRGRRSHFRDLEERRFRGYLPASLSFSLLRSGFALESLISHRAR